MPSTAIWSTADAANRRERRAVAAVVGAGMALFWLVATSWRPWTLFERAGFSADFYDEQARSFVRGRLSVRPEIASHEGFVVDGETHFYYGPFLAVVRIPFALFGDVFAGRLVIASMLVALAVLGLSTARLGRAAQRVVCPDGTAATWPLLLLVGAVTFSPALFAAGWISVYHETELWACALAVVTIGLLAEWAAAGFVDRARLAWGVVALTATTLTRVPIGIGVACSLGVIGLGLAWRSRERRGRAGWWAIGGAILPLALHAVVNAARFGTLFSVPGDRQVLTFQDPERAAFFEATGGSFFDPRFLPTTLVHYLRPDTIRFERHVPGIRFGPLAEDRGSLAVETITPASSLPASATLLLLVAVVGVVWLIARQARTWLVLVAGGVVGAVPTFLIGFVANRYLIDMLPPLITAGAIGAWVLGDRAGARSTRPWIVAGTLLVVWGAWVNAALATWTLEYKSPGFTEFRSDVDAALFGGGDVGIVLLDPTAEAPAPVPRDGIVGLADGCAGVYIAEQGNWVALERAANVFEVTATLTHDDLADRNDAPMRIAATSAWTVDVVANGDAGPVLVFETPSAPNAEVVAIPALPVDLRLVVDPVTGESFVEFDRDASLLPGTAVDSVTPAGIGTGRTSPSPLCVKLRERYDGPGASTGAADTVTR